MKYMDDGEIIREYKAAKDQKKMIEVLADRNCMSNREMAEWLAANGQTVDKRYLSSGIRPKKERQEEPKTPTPAPCPARIKVYISGPITGNPDYAVEFCEIETWLREYGFEVVNPVRNMADNYKGYIDIGLQQLMSCNMICMLPGWNDSDGANLEKAYAEAVELPQLHLPHKVWARIQKLADMTIVGDETEPGIQTIATPCRQQFMQKRG